MVKVLIRKLDPAVKLPEYKTNGASGMDIIAFIKKPISLKPKMSSIIPTGLSVAFSKNYEIQIRPRSGLAAKNNITILNTPGTIDSDYRGEIKVIIYNHGKEEFIINNGDRIAQMILTPVLKIELEETNGDLPETIRGEGGFGSTGK
jgi:dUTP pyrophosphatase